MVHQKEDEGKNFKAKVEAIEKILILAASGCSDYD